MSDWQKIETAPMGRIIDVWLWELGDDGQPLEGFRLPDVRLRDGGDPTLLEISTGDDWDDYYPHENGCWASHWRELPEPPAAS